MSEDDWAGSPARIVAGAAVLALVGAGMLIGAAEGRGAPGNGGGSAIRVEEATRLLDVNRATPAELDLLPRIGPKRAAAIVEERERGGAFSSLDDLERVRGIGPRTVEALRPLATAGR